MSKRTRGILADFQATQAANLNGGGANSEGLGWASGITNKTQAQKALESAEAVQDIMDYYQERDGKSFATADEAREYFMSDRRYRGMNSFGLGGEIIGLNSASDTQKLRLARLQTLFDNLPSFYEEGGDGWKGFAANAGYALLDPVNLIGFGSGAAAAKAAGVAARTAVQGSIKQGALNKMKREATMKGLGAGLKTGMRNEAIVGGITEGGFNVAEQNRNIGIGLQNDFSYGQLAKATAAGTIFSGALGAGFGLAGAANPFNMKYAIIPTKGKQGLMGSAQNKTSSKGYMPAAVKQGIMEGQQSIRSGMADVNLDPTGAVSRGVDTDPSEETLNSKRQLAEQIEGLASRLDDDADLDQSTGATVSEDGKTVNIPDPNKVELSQASRLRKAADTMLNLADEAERLKREAADPDMDAKKRGELQDKARRNTQVSNSIEASFNRLLNPEKNVTGAEATAQLNDLERHINSGQKLLGFEETPEGQPTTVISGQASAADANIPVRQEGAEARAAQDEQLKSLQEDYEKRLESVSDEAEAESLRTNIEAIKKARVTGEIPESISLPERATNPVQELETKAATITKTIEQTKARVGEATAALQTARENYASAKADGAEPARLQELETAGNEAKARLEAHNSELTQLTRDLESTNAQLSARKTDEVKPAPEEGEAPAQETQSVQNQMEPDADLEEPTADSVDTIMGRIGTSTDNMVQALVEIGEDAKVATRRLKQFGDARKPEVKRKQTEYVRSRVEDYVSREHMFSTLDNMFGGMDTASSMNMRAVVTAIKNTVPEAQQEAALAHYDRYVTARSKQLLINRMADEGLDLADALVEIQKEFGDDVMSLAAESFNVLGVQKAGIPGGAGDDLDKLLNILSEENRVALGDGLTKTVRNLMEKQGMSEEDAIDMARDVTARKAENMIRRSPQILQRDVNQLASDKAKVGTQITELKALRSMIMDMKATGKFRDKGKMVFDDVKTYYADYENMTMVKTGQKVRVFFDASGEPTADEIRYYRTRAQIAEIQGKLGMGGLSLGEMISRLEARAAGIDATIQAGGAVELDIQSLKTRGTRDFSVHDEYSQNARFQGAQRRQGLGEYTSYGKEVKGGSAIEGRSQGILGGSNKHGMIRGTRLIDRAKAVDTNGATYRMSGVMTAIKAQYKSQIDRATNRMEYDNIKAERNADLVEPMQAVKTELRSLDGKIRSRQKKLDEMADLSSEKAVNLEDEIAELQADRRAAINRIESLLQDNVFIRNNDTGDRDTTLIAALNDNLQWLTRSTGKEAAGNRAEVGMDTAMLNATRDQIRKVEREIARIQTREANGEPINSFELQQLEKNLANMQRQLENNGSATDKQITKAIGITVRGERMTEEALKEGAVLNRTDLDGEPIPVDEIQKAEANANEIARLEGIKKIVADFVKKEALPELSEEQLTAVLSRAMELAEQLKSAKTKPDSAPAEVKNDPFVVAVDVGDGRAIEVDVKNDFTYKQNILSKDVTDISFFGTKVGSVAKVKGGDKAGYIYQGLDGNEVEFSSKVEFLKYLAVRHKDLIKSKQEAQPYFDEVPSGGASYSVPDHRVSETYKASDQKPVAEATDPIENPPVEFDPNNPMTARATSFDVPAGKWVAVQILGNGKERGKVRPFNLNDKQTLKDVLGKQTEYVVGYVDYGSKGIAAQTSFRPMNQEEHFLPMGMDETVRADEYKPTKEELTRSSPRQRKVRPKKIEDLSTIIIEEATPEMLERGIRTAADLHDYIQDMDNIDWQSIGSIENYNAWMETRMEASALMRRYAPHGVEKPTSTIRGSVASLHNVIGHATPEELQSVEDILTRLAYHNQGVAPTFADGGAVGVNAGYVLNTNYNYKSLRNKILLDGDILEPTAETGERHLPSSAIVMHELGHWIYSNLLDESDKLQFWGAMGKYAGEEGVNIDMLTKRADMGDANGVPVFNNALNSPAEFFANQFMAWAVTNRQVADSGLWTKVSKIAHALIKRIRGEEFQLDEDIVPIFQRYLPELDIDPVTGSVNGGVSRFAGLDAIARKIAKNPQRGAHIASRLETLDNQRVELMAALRHINANPNDTIELGKTLEKVHKSIFRFHGGKGGQPTHRDGTTRDMVLDGTSARNALFKTQKNIKEFLDAVRAGVAGKNGDRVREIMRGQEADISTDNVDAATLRMIEMGDYSNVDAEVAVHMRRLANEMIWAINQGIRTYRSEFSKTLPKSARGESVVLRDDGSAYLGQPSDKSLLFMRKFNEAQRAQANKSSAALLSSINKRNANIYLDSAENAEVSVGSSHKTMSKEVIDTQILATSEETVKHVNLVNERISKENTEPPQIDLDDLSEEELAGYNQLLDMDDDQLRRIYREAINANSKKFVGLVTSILKARGHDAPKALESSKATDVVNKVVEHSAGESDDIGIHPNAPEALKEAVSAVTHRDKRQMFVARELMQRMAYMLGIDENDASSGITEYAAVSMQGRVADDFDDADLIDLDTNLYKELRNEMRGLAKLAKENAPEFVNKMAMFSYNMRSPSERKLILEAMQYAGQEPSNYRVVEKELQRLVQLHLMGSVPYKQLLEGEGLADWPSLPTLAKMLDNITDEVGALTNGIIDDPNRKNMYQLAAYGDVFSSYKSKAPIVDASHSVRDDVIHPVIAPQYGRQLSDNMPLAQEMAIRSWAGIPFDENLSGRIMFNVSVDGKVRGVTPSVGEYGTGVYVTKGDQLNSRYEPEAFMNNIIERAKNVGVKAADMETVKAAAKQIVSLRAEIQRQVSARTPDARTIQVRLRQEQRMWDILNGINPSIHDQKVAPVFARSRVSLGFGSRNKYTLVGDAQNNISYMVEDMAKKGLLKGEGVDALVNFFQTEFDGRRLYTALTNDEFGLLHKAGSALDGADARNKLNKYLQESGFDALETDEGLVVFDTDNVRHATRGYSQHEFQSLRPEERGADGKLAGEVAVDMFYTGKPFNPARFPRIAAGIQAAGMPSGVAKPLKKMLKRQALSESDVKSVSKLSSALSVFKENSQKFRILGAKWFGDAIKPENGIGLFEKHDVELGRILQPIFNELEKLPDSGNMFSRWNQRNKGLLFMEVSQPKSHLRIVEALRMGRGAVEALKPQERAIAMRIAKVFANELDALRELDIPVGDVRPRGNGFYIPQVWDSESILANPNQFRMAMTNFLTREQNRPDFLGRTKLTRAEIAQRVQMLEAKLTAQDGVMDTVDAIKYSIPDAFQRRVLNLQPEDVPELMPFMVNNLQGLMAKYFDRTVRKRMLTQKFGLNGHAVDEYKAIARGGVPAAVEILQSNRAMTIRNDKTQIQYEVEQHPHVNQLRGNKEEIERILRQVSQELSVPEEQKHAAKQRAINILLNAQTAEGRAQHGYVRRVEAVVNALSDFPEGGMSYSTLNKMDSMMNVLNRRPIDGSSGNETKHKVVRTLKSFNSVTLLSFTALTSLPDLALPLIRSGNMRAFGKAWVQYMANPSYRQAAKNIGTGIENMLHDRMTHMAGSGSQKFTNSFFNATFLTSWTNFNREIAAMVGMEAFKSEIENARRAYMSAGRDSFSYKKAKRFLERYGLTGPDAEHDFLSNSSFRIDEIPQGREDVQLQVRAAMLRFTNEAIFTPNPNDVPMWAQTPWGSLMFQLKSFPLMMARLTKHVGIEAGKGNVLPAVYMATAGVGAGALSLTAKDIVQMRGGEDERSAETRSRSLSKNAPALANAFGVREGSDLDSYAGWYLDSLLAMGGLGLFAEFFYNAASQADNGAYGKMRVAGAVAGPSFSAIFDSGMTVATGVKDAITGAEKNSNKRAAAREIARRIPVAGGISDFREGAADLMGQPSKPGRKGGFGSSTFGSSNFGKGKFGD